jgi:hypothetical protein
VGGHALCGAHLLRELTAVTETGTTDDAIWARQAIDSLLELKKATDAARAAGHDVIDAEVLEKHGRWFRDAADAGAVLNAARRSKLQKKRHALATLVGGLMARTAPVHRVLEEAARSDQGAAAALAELARQRHDGQRRITRSLIRAGALRPGLKEREAADIVHALASPEVYRLLVTDRGWSGERYKQWLSSILIDQLLPATTRR